MSNEAIIFTGVGMYLVIMLAIGIYASKRASASAADFIVAGRNMPIWICSATIIATWFGGGTMMGAAGASYDGGLFAVIADPFGGALCLFLVGFFFVRIFRRLRLLTFIDFFENRYGKTAATIAAIGSISSNIGWTGALLVAFGFVFQTLTGVPIEMGIIGGAIVVFIYTVAGGMWAVALTDFVQMVVIAIGLVSLLVVVLIDVGGWGNIVLSASVRDRCVRARPPRWLRNKWQVSHCHRRGCRECQVQDRARRKNDARRQPFPGMSRLPIGYSRHLR